MTMPEPGNVLRTQNSKANGGFVRILRFIRKPWPEKTKVIQQRMLSLLSRVPTVVRLPFGAYWIARNDNLGEPLLAGTFEAAEQAFVGRFLRPGMTVLDLGAHHGLYTLLASKCVGRGGVVVSFEPSPRERRALRLHVWLNSCRNVSIQGLALGNENGSAILHLVRGNQTGCNSLRPPDVSSKTSPVQIRVVRLDDWLSQHQVDRVDLIKLDVEGAELNALKGATQLLERRPRPVILAEVQDIRTLPWGYRAKDIIEHLRYRGYKWFELSKNGAVEPLDVSQDNLDGNFVAYPEEWNESNP